MEVVDAASREELLTHDALLEVYQRRPAITDDGSLAAFPSPSGNIAVANVESGAVSEIPDSSMWNVYLDFTDDGRLLAGAALTDSIGVWDVDTMRSVITLTGHGDHIPAHESDARARGRVDEIVFRPGSDELFSAGYDGTIRVWNVETGENRILRTFDYEVVSLAFSSDGSSLALALRSGSVTIMNADSRVVELELEAVSGGPELAFSPDGRVLAGAGPGPIVHLWDTRTGLLQRRLHGAIYPTTGVVFVNDGKELRVVSGEGVERGYLLDPLELVALARQEVGRDMTEEECQRYLRRSCDD
jgi:WD40 repeat protein